MSARLSTDASPATCSGAIYPTVPIKTPGSVTGAGFVTLAATLTALPVVPVQSIALLVGIDRFMSECRALTNIIGNGVATIVVSKWERELDQDRLRAELKNPSTDEGSLRQQAAHETA